MLLQPPIPVSTEKTTARRMTKEEHVPSWVTAQGTFAAAERDGFWTLIRRVYVR